MALANLAQSPSVSKRGPDCTVCQALKTLDPKDAELLLGALKDPQWRYSAIAAHLADDETLPDWVRGINGGTLAKHSRGDCAARTKLR